MATAAELLNRHGISYVASKAGRYTTGCPTCGNDGYLNVTIDRDGVKWFCHVCKEGGGALFNEKKFDRSSDFGAPVAVYDYNDESGTLLFQALRFEPIGQPKQFLLRKSPDQKKWSINGVRIVPFKLPELHEDIAAEKVVFIVEGEKDVLTLRAAGVPATCNPMGAGKWRAEFNEHLKGADVVVCGDNDQPGRDHVDKVARSLHGTVKRLRVLDLAKIWPAMQPSEDISDWLKVHNVEQLWYEVERLPDYKPPTNGNGSVVLDPNAIKPPAEILSKANFIGKFTPPDYLIDGMLQRRYLYALTGQTGHAKTAVALLIARLVSCADKNVRLKNHLVEKGRVVYFVGENDDDVRMRVIGADLQRTDNPAADNISFVPGNFKINEMMPYLEADFREHGEVSLIIVDTSAAYFQGDEEISNNQMQDHANMMRALTKLPGGPCVLVLCHPIKHAFEPAQLLPRGGGAFLAAVDGNLTLWRKTDDMAELFYNKMRGPGFQMLTFSLDTIRHPQLCDGKGRMLPTVQAVVITDSEEVKREEKTADDDDRVLTALLHSPYGSLASWAEFLGWVSDTGDPYKVKISRICERLSKPPSKPFLTRKERNRWVLTEEGEVRARKAAMTFREQDEKAAATQSQSAMF